MDGCEFVEEDKVEDTHEGIQVDVALESPGSVTGVDSAGAIDSESSVGSIVTIVPVLFVLLSGLDPSACICSVVKLDPPESVVMGLTVDPAEPEESVVIVDPEMLVGSSVTVDTEELVGSVVTEASAPPEVS